MDRLRFDRWLLSMVPDTVDVRLGCRLHAYESQGEGCHLVLGRNGSRYTETARIVVGADGAASRARALLGSKGPAPKRYFAIQEWVEAAGSTPYFSSIFAPEITDYYCWTIPKDSHLLIGAALPPRDSTAGRFELLKSRLKDWGIEFGKTICREGTYLLRPESVRQISTGAGRVILVGEAAGWISPSSAEGLSYAFRSARILAEVLHAGLDNVERRYHRATLSMRRNILLKSLKSRVVFNPTLRGAVMRLGLRSMTVCGLNRGAARASRQASTRTC